MPLIQDWSNPSPRGSRICPSSEALDRAVGTAQEWAHAPASPDLLDNAVGIVQDPSLC